MKRTGHFYFHDFNQDAKAENSETIIKRIFWCVLIIAVLLVIQDRMNLDTEKFQAEQAAIRAASCN